MATPEQMQILITAQTKDAVDKVQRLSRQLDGVSDKAANASGSFSRLGSRAGQAGIQIQQLVGQVQGGVSPMVALSQQAADLGFVLGVPLVGAAAAIAASFAGPLVQALTSTTDSFGELEDKVRGLEMAYRDLTQAERDLLELQLATEISTVEKVIGGLNRSIEDLTKSFAEIEDVADVGFETFAEDVAGTDEELIKLRASLALYTRDLQRLKGDLELVRDPTKQVTEEQEKKEKAVKKSTRAIKEQTKVIKDSKGPLEQYRDSISDIEKSLESASVRGLRRMEDGLLGVVKGTESASDAFRNMAASIIDDMIRIQLQQQITGPLSGLLGAAIGSFFGPSVSGGGGTSGAGGPVQQGVILDSFDGGGYTGSGARSGGLDGKGGFAAMLHPNETVIDHSKGQTSGGVTVVQNISISTGVQQTVRNEIQSLLPQIANASKAAVLDARKRGGSFAGAFG